MSDYWPKILVLLLSCICFFTGCNRQTQGRLSTVQVTGVVSYRGVPLTQGQIKFLPVKGAKESARAAYGFLDERGRYRLGTYEEEDGAIPGDYLVIVESRDELPDDQVKQMLIRGERPPEAKSLIPERFVNPVSSGLTAQVGLEGNVIDFDLKD